MATATPDEFPNDWDKVARTPEERFATPTYEEICLRAGGWKLPSSVAGIVRVENEDGTINEFVLDTRRKMTRTVNSLAAKHIPYTVYDNDTMGFNYEVEGADDEC
jgi:hypothetical protein